MGFVGFIGFKGFIMRGFRPKIRGTIMGVLIIRTIAFWGSILGSPYAFGQLPRVCGLGFRMWLREREHWTGRWTCEFRVGRFLRCTL